MRVMSRVALVAVVLLAVSVPVSADHMLADCPLTLVGNNPAATDFNLSPHGAFRSGNLIYVLRGQALTTFTVTELGDLQVAREDFIGSLAARDTQAGVAFQNGFLFISSEAGLEIFNLQNVRAGGSAPALVSRTPGIHYRRLAVEGTVLAALWPTNDLPCFPTFTSFCFNTIDLFNISSMTNVFKAGSISSTASRNFLGFNDITFNQGFLVAAAEGGTTLFNVSNPAAPATLGQLGPRGTFLVSNGTNLLGIGVDNQIRVFTVSLGGFLTQVTLFTLAAEGIDRANPIMFHPQGYFDEMNGRLITMIDERNPFTLRPARTIAFDVFDMTVPLWEGSFNRGYETVSYVAPDEVKWNPVAVGSNVYTIGEVSGVQTWGACGVAAGRIEWDGTQALNCGGAEIHGWVTGERKIANVEVFLDNGSLGPATLTGLPRTDISSRTPVQTFKIAVNLDQTARGEHTIRAVATDALGVRRQFAAQRIFFGGPGANCTNRRRVGSR